MIAPNAASAQITPRCQMFSSALLRRHPKNTAMPTAANRPTRGSREVSETAPP